MVTAEHVPVPPPPPSKVWWRSKVVWLNVLTILTLASTLPEVVEIVPPSWIPRIAALNAILNLILRIHTGVPLGRRET